MLRVDSTSLGTIDILANDTDADSNPLTVAIEEPAFVGTAVANPDGTVRLESLPGGFKGITRFRYRVTDPGGLSSSATAVVFVGTDPFRAVFAGDASANGSYEIYLADFVSAPSMVTTAADSSLRLHSFATSANGATIVYRRTSTATPSTSDLSFVRTSTPRQDVRIAIPAGVTLVPDAAPDDQYKVSDDGQWIAFVARDGLDADAVYLLNVESPTTVTKVNIAGAMRVKLPRFASNSRMLYVLASSSTGGINRDLYAVALDTFAVGRVSTRSAAASADDVLDYTVAPDQSRILLRANRAGRVGLYFIDAAQLQTEARVNQALGLDDIIHETTVGLPPGGGGSILGQKVAYTVEGPGDDGQITFSTWVAEVSATPNPRRIATNGARSRGFRPDDAAVLFSRAGQILETPLDASTTEQFVGAGANGWYDSTGNIVLIQQFLPSSGSPSTYPALASTVRGGFGTTRPVGSPVLAAHFRDASGFDRAVVLIGEGPTSGSAPTTGRVALVNAMAPDKLLYLADFPSPLQLASSTAIIVR